MNNNLFHPVNEATFKSPIMGKIYDGAHKILTNKLINAIKNRQDPKPFSDKKVKLIDYQQNRFFKQWERRNNERNKNIVDTFRKNADDFANKLFSKYLNK